MHNARARLMAALAGATLCLFAVTSYAQSPTTTTGAPDASAQAPAQPTTPAPTTDPLVTGSATDVVTTTETTTWSFPGGIWGILAVGLLAIFLLFTLFRGRKTTVVNETYVSPNTGPGSRNAGMGTAVGDRNLNPRTASGTEPRSGGVNEPPPNARQ